MVPSVEVDESLGSVLAGTKSSRQMAQVGCCRGVGRWLEVYGAGGSSSTLSSAAPGVRMYAAEGGSGTPEP